MNPRSLSLVACLTLACGQLGFEDTDSGDAPDTDAAAPTDVGSDAVLPEDANSDALLDAPLMDAPLMDAPVDAGPDAPPADAGPDAPADAGSDASDAGPVCPALGLRAWYRLDEVAGPVLDSSGCGLDGVAVGVTRGEPGVLGSSVRWNNTGSIHVPAFAMTPAEYPSYTVEAWVDYNDSPLAAIAAASNGMGGDPFIFGIFTADELTVSLPGAACTGMTTYTDPSGFIIPRSTWTHVAVSVVPATGEMRYFINGRLTGTDVAVAPLFCESPDGLYLGTLGTSTSWALKGRLDDIKIWNQLRSEDEVCTDAGGVVSGIDCDLSALLPGG